MKSFASMTAVLCFCLITPTQAQTIKPDTLADLKAEYERHRAITTPLIALYREAEDKRMACAERMFTNPVRTLCDAEIRELRLIASIGERPLSMALAAKEAYERELRKAERNNPVKH